MIIHRDKIAAASWVLAFFFLFNSLTPFSYSDEPAAAEESFKEGAEDFSGAAQNNFPPLSQNPTATPDAQAGTHAPSGQKADPEPVQNQDLIDYQEYQAKLKELREAYEKGEISERKFLRKTKKLKRKFQRSERFRGHGYDKNRPSDHRPIETRAIQIERNQIDVGQESD